MLAWKVWIPCSGTFVLRVVELVIICVVFVMFSKVESKVAKM